ncbi:CHASE3 domain-containing protein, partial [Acinetobacter baumannii]
TLLAGAITLAMLSVIGLISLKQAQQSRNIAEWVSHSHSIINNLNACRRLADTADNQARGYTETGDSEFLSGYRAHSTELIAQCGVLAELVS